MMEVISNEDDYDPMSDDGFAVPYDISRSEVFDENSTDAEGKEDIDDVDDAFELTSNSEAEGGADLPWFCYLIICTKPNQSTKTMTHIGKSRTPLKKVTARNMKRGRGKKIVWELSMVLGPFHAKELADHAKAMWNTSRG